MRKLLVALLLGVAVGLGFKAHLAEAQFLPPAGCSYLTQQAYCSQASGTPALILNSPGSNYGQLFGSSVLTNGVYTFSLGSGSSVATNGTAAITYDTNQMVTMNGIEVLAKTTVGANSLAGVNASTTVPATSSYVTVLSSSANGTAIKLTSTPSISTVNAQGYPLPSGAFMIIASTVSNAPLIFQDNGTLSGSLLNLVNSTATVSNTQTLSLIFDAVDGRWHQFGANPKNQ